MLQRWKRQQLEIAARYERDWSIPKSVLWKEQLLKPIGCLFEVILIHAVDKFGFPDVANLEMVLKELTKWTKKRSFVFVKLGYNANGCSCTSAGSDVSPMEYIINAFHQSAFRYVEDIVWQTDRREKCEICGKVFRVKQSVQHCVMGIRGVLWKNTCHDVFHTNLWTNVVNQEEELYELIEHCIPSFERLQMDCGGGLVENRLGWVTLKEDEWSTFSKEEYELHVEYMVQLTRSNPKWKLLENEIQKKRPRQWMGKK